MLLVGQFQHANGAGHTNRLATHHSLHEGHGLAIGLDEQVLRGGSRRGFAAVIGLHHRTVGMQQEGTATDAAGLRLDQGEHHLHRHGSIDCAAAGFEHLVTGIGGQRVGRRYRKTPGGPARFGLLGRRAFRLLIRHLIGQDGLRRHAST